MNIKLKFNLLRYWSGRINKNQGFAIPIAMGLGIGITLVGLSMLIKTQADQAKAYSQKQKSESLTAAEIGVTQVQSLINSNKVLLEYPSQCTGSETNNCWSNIKTTVADNTNTPSFQDELEIAPNNGICSNRTTSQIEQTLSKIRTIATSNPNDVNTWEKVNGGSTTEVEYYYRLVGYEYDNANKLGVLTIEGLAKHPSATNNSNDSSESRTRLKVNVNIIKQAPSVLQRPTAPGLWLTSGATNDGSAGHTINSDGSYGANSTYQADVLLSDCSMALPNYPKYPNINQQTVISGIEWQLNNSVVKDDPGPDGSLNSTADNIDYKGAVLKLDQPPAPTQPSFSSSMVLGDIGSSNLTLPRPGDIPQNITRTGTDTQGNPVDETVSVYQYSVSSIDTNGNKKITITPGAKVILYVNGNIDSRGNGGIEHNCADAPAGTACKPTDFYIFGYVTPSNPNPTICLRGGATLEGFILAPGYDVGVTGNGSFKGSIWAKSWGKISNCGSNNGKVAVIQSASLDQLLFNFQIPTLPQLGRVANWEQVEEIASSPSTSPSVSPSTSP